MNQNTAVLNGSTTFSDLPVAPLPRTSGSPWMNPLPTPSAQTSICNDNVNGQPSALRDDVPRTVSTTDAMGITDHDSQLVGEVVTFKREGQLPVQLACSRLYTPSCDGCCRVVYAHQS